MSDDSHNEITVHLRFRSSGDGGDPVTVGEVHNWLTGDAGIASLTRRHDTQVKIMISDGHCSEVIDLDGSRPDEDTMVMGE